MRIVRTARTLLRPKFMVAGASILAAATAVWVIDVRAGIAVALALLGLGLGLVVVLVRRLGSTLRSIDSHIGATRRQTRELVEQGLVDADARTSRRRAEAVRVLRDRVWAGFEVDSVDELERLVYGTNSDRATRSDASTVLSAWIFTAGSAADAYRTIAVSRIASPTVDRRPAAVALEADYLVSLGRLADARALLSDAGALGVAGTETSFRLANTYDPRASEFDEARLNHINAAFLTGPVGTIQRRDVGERLTLSNLRGTNQRRAVDAGTQPTVSVIMPMRNAEATVGYALRSVLEQTWSNLQVVVVDDGSDDRTVAIVESLAEQDDRVEIHRRSGEGAYVARNFGLSCCIGDYVTVHDADDWSHPEKIERQVRAMQESGGKRASWSFWIRCSDDLVFCEPSLRPQHRRVVPNFSSFMLERSVFDDLGTWDEAVVSSDAEFVRRLEAFDGSDSIVRVLPGVPLSFGLRSYGSLTGDGPLGVLTLHHIAGARRQYREAYRAWHARSSFRDALPFDPRRELPFCRPRLMDLEKRNIEDPRDLVIVGDYSESASRGRRLETITRALADAGLRVGIIHLPVGGPAHGPDSRVLAAIDGERLRVISSGETVAAEMVLVEDARVLRTPVSRAPRIESKRALVVFRRPGSDLDAGNVEASLIALGISAARWSASNSTLAPELRALLRDLGPGHQLDDSPWRDLPNRDDASVPERQGVDAPVVIKLIGVDPAARPGWFRSHLGTVNGITLFDDTESGQADQGDESESYDLALLVGAVPTDHDDILAVLRLPVPVIAHRCFEPLLGDGALYVEDGSWSDAVVSVTSSDAAWREQRDAIVRTVSTDFEPGAVVDRLRSRIVDSTAST